MSLGTLQLAGLVLGAGALAVSLASLALPRRSARWRRLPPETRGRWLLAWAVAPVAAPAALLLLCLLPPALGAWQPGGDHCLSHPGHPHLCAVHGAALVTGIWGLLALGGAVPLAAAGWVWWRGWRAGRRLCASLGAGERARPGPLAERLAVSQPLSLTIGLLRPRIHVSDGLAEALSPAELAVVLAHERAHARRRDGMRKLAAAALGRAHLPPVRRWLARELSLACEQACDAEAGRRVGDRLRVAETILATERLMAGQARGRSVCAFGGSAVAERVQALLQPPPPRASTGPALRWALAAALVAVVLGAADPLHHLVEHLLALILA